MAYPSDEKKNTGDQRQTLFGSHTFNAKRNHPIIYETAATSEWRMEKVYENLIVHLATLFEFPTKRIVMNITICLRWCSSR